MYASHYVFGRGFFVAWIVVSIIWVWGTMIVAGFYPIIDGWSQLRLVYQGLRGHSRGQKDSDGVQSPSSDSSVINAGEEKAPATVPS
jgi:urea-proton symporter